ncbi:MAG: SMC family ATPase [Actinomycetaceae bacterium]|nr:SMC family ATPase [Actinomycetaceae bacterium]
MKLLELSFAGIGPFASAQTLNFTNYQNDGLFLLTGPTGSGKTTILDAIVYALYGALADPQADKERMRCAFCTDTDPSWVQLDFEVSAGTFRIRRTPPFWRAKTRGSGKVKTSETVVLSKVAGTEQKVLSSKIAETAALIYELVGLNIEQFRQTIILPQGKFDKFLRSDTDTRKKVLQSIFRTFAYDRFAALVADKAREVANENTLLRHSEDAARASLQTLLSREQCELDGEELAESFIADLNEKLRHVRQVHDLARRQAETAEKDLEIAKNLHTQQQTYREAMQKKAALDEQQETITAARRRVERASAAEKVSGFISAARHTDQQLSQNQQRLHKLTEKLQGALEKTDLTARENVVEDATHAASALQDLVVLEKTLSARAVALENDKLQTIKLRENTAKIQSQLTATTQYISALKDKVSAAINAGKKLAELLEQKQLLTAEKQKLEKWQNAKEALQKISDRLHEVGKNKVLAAERAARLHARFALAAASELATHLEDGVPCLVCGSTSHPAPAEKSPDTIATDELMDATKVAAAAEEKYSNLKLQHSEAKKLTDECAAQADRSTDFEALLYGLGIEIETAQKYANNLDTSQLELEEKTNESTALRDQLGALTTKLELLTKKIDTETAQLESDKASVAAAIFAPAKSVAQTQDNLLQVQQLATRQEQLHDDNVLLQRRRYVAHAELTQNLRGFKDVAEATAALLPTAEITAMNAQITAWENEQFAVAKQLDDPQLRVAATAPTPDLPPLIKAAEDARTALALATEELGSAKQRDAASRTVLTDYLQARHNLAEFQDSTADLRWVANLVAGGDSNQQRAPLATWVLIDRLEQTLQVANPILDKMSQGRYQLVRVGSDGSRRLNQALSLAVMDYITGVTRATTSLSGGETFYCSLALALALAEVVTAEAGGITIETMLIDEGFGSLDPEKLEVVMAQLQGHNAQRVIGIISHVSELKQQVNARVEVRPTDVGSRLHKEV